MRGINMKVKVLIGIVIMFIQLSVISLFSMYHAYQLAYMGKSQFVNNTRSIQYCERIIQTFDEVMRRQDKSLSRDEVDEKIKIIDFNIESEEANITEKGERNLVASVRANFDILKKTPGAIRYSSPIVHSVVDDVHSIIKLNAKAIERENKAINSYEDRFYQRLAILATCCFIISVLMIFNFPEYAAIPNIRFKKADADTINQEINKKD